MFNNALKHISSGLSKFTSNLSSTTQKVVDIFPNKVKQIISSEVKAANDENYDISTQSNINNIQKSTEKILKNSHRLWNYTWSKILTLTSEKYRLIYRNGEVIWWNLVKDDKIDEQISEEKLKEIIHKLSISSSKTSKRVSFSTKRNVKDNNSINKFNTKLHWGYTYTNELKTQFDLIINKWKIISAKYKNSTTLISKEELEVIQASINKDSSKLTNHISARRIKKEMQKNKTSSESKTKLHKSKKLNGTKKHNDAILEKQRREKIKAEKQEKEKYRIEKEAHLQEDYKTLFRYQLALSKCNTQGNIINGSDNIAEIVLKTLAARKWITLHNFNNFLSTRNKFEVFKKVIREYLTIDKSFSIVAQENRNWLYNIFINASEIYSTYLYQKSKSSSKRKRKTGPNIYEHQQNSYSQEDIEREKDDWVKKYYWTKQAA